MYRKLLSALALSTTCFASAQSYVHQVLVLNEGYFNWQDQQQVVPVTLGSYDPTTGQYTTVATIEGSRFGSDVEIAGDHVLVAADDKLLKYDRNTFELLEAAQITGIRKIAVHEDKVLVTRGELGGLSHYFEVRDLNDLAFITAITPDQGLPHSVEDVVVAGGFAWLGVNNSFDWMALTGYVAKVELESFTIDAIVELGENGLNPEKLMVTDEALFVLNNTDFSASSISRIPLDAPLDAQTIVIATNSGCGASALAPSQQKVYFMEYAVNTLARYDIVSNTVSDTLAGQLSAYGLIDDPINGVMYMTTTDFFSSGELHVMNYDGSTLSTVAVGVSPGHLALDVRSSTGTDHSYEGAWLAYPNPADDVIRVMGPADGTIRYTVVDAVGRVAAAGTGNMSSQGMIIDVSALASGHYTVNIAGHAPIRFMKR